MFAHGELQRTAVELQQATAGTYRASSTKESSSPHPPPRPAQAALTDPETACTPERQRFDLFFFSSFFF